MSKLLKSKFLFGMIVLVAVAVVASTADASITSTLRKGSRGAQVVELQTALGLNADGIFGNLTKAAVATWQASKGLVADGIFGAKSRAVFSGGSVGSFAPAGCTSASGYSPSLGLAGGPCHAVASEQSNGCQAGWLFNPATGLSCTGVVNNTSGVASVALASDNPASGTVPDAANANFTKFTISSGAIATTITNLYVTRYGLSINSDVENIKILDQDMVQVSSSGSLNSNNKAQISFSPALTIPANTVKSFYIRAGIVDGTVGGKSVALGIDSASDITANVSIGGSFPVKGNLMNTVLLTIGTLTADEDGTVTDSQPDGGDVDVVVNKFKLTAGSTESVTVRQIAVERQGTASASDVANIELFDVSKAVSLGTAASWDANGLATFNNLNIVLDKGETRRFEVRVDIIGGSSLTVNADLTDGSDVRVQAVGDIYGFYITPTNSMTNGQGASNQTIQSGTLTITRSASTPAAGNISSGSDVALAVFDFQVLGEPMKVTSINVDSTFGGGPMLYTEVTNVKLVDATTGALLAGPKDLVVTTEDATFTDVIIFPVGVTKVKVTANIASSVSLNDTIKIDLDDPSTGVVAKGMTSNDSVTPSPASAVSGNTMVVQAAALTAVTNTTPAIRSVVIGQQDFVWSTFTLSASNSGEDVNVSTVVVENTATVAEGTDSGGEDVDNVEIWADLTSGSSARGDVYETLVSTTKQFTGTSATDTLLTFNLNPIVTVLKNSSVSFAVVADLSASAEVDDTFAISLDTDEGDVTANGKTTGSTVTLTPSGAGQAMTVATGGTLTISVDSSYNSTAPLLMDTSAEQVVGAFRLAANNTENLNVDSIKITDDGTNGNDVVASFKFYSGSTLLGTVAPDGSGNGELFLASGQLVVSAGSYKIVTVKAVLNDIDGTGFVNGDTLEVTIAAAGDVDTTGLASGAAVDSTEENVDAPTHTVYEAYPTITLDLVAAPGGNLTLNSNQLVAVLKIYNNGDQDITFEASDSNISMQAVIVGDDTDTASETITIKDEDGNTLDISTDATVAADFNSASGTLQFDFDFSTAALTVAPGTTERIYVYADTSDLEDDNDSIQIWLDDVAADLEWAIDNDDGEYQEGDYVFKNDIFGMTYTNPT
ncbi:hypothetical protein A2456_01025 [Candidatus Nomurabacteria bacterium RIFOXYC2_FULL_36_19]|uniref:Peptidoglycan binding-like domain-containing protein n=2 Tax=Candidatus Nomuraibacteriota TaxID=1752729 RepID=A0A1F6YR90_9BACT|nr:MAG: hypothetical protein A2192_02390 [Candidatus Nomurabacteria bacterium RIFOXYA1_FULL_35_17]OGJ08902.1 MAG: hypothetical protein A2456_01025 [Candidatus Nomurabacteria bacterium RIFOXYC2_FULL_36_19]OGJ14463.1 MAG: hypothetical protein A2554_01335 [Candidatus Nomurabacteria bacterium RIFOXYD2_FULL_35_12]